MGETCLEYEIPFCLEPLSFSLDSAVNKLASPEKRQVVIETARRLTPMGVDVLKAEFPLNIADEPDEAVWAGACVQLSEASLVPWVLLSAGVNFEEFKRQTVVACRAGASGVMAGRSVWKEAADLEGDAQAAFLEMTARERMVCLGKIIAEHAQPLTGYRQQLIVEEGWYLHY